MIEQPAIIITSLGRTGTKFFAAFFRDLLPLATVLHEPDIFNMGKGETTHEVVGQIKTAGFRRMVWDKLRRKWGIVYLSDARLKQEVGYEAAVAELCRQRVPFVSQLPGSMYVESSVGYYGLLDVLAAAFAHHRAAYIVRDGREWVRSEMNWGEMYNKGQLRRLVAHNWPTAAAVPDDACAAEWATMSRFERICWAWSRLNGYALQTAASNPQARVFRFEALFKSPEKYDHLAEMVNFVTEIGGAPAVSAASLAGRLEQRVHQGAGAFPDWAGWSAAQKAAFERLCGPLMAQLNY